MNTDVAAWLWAEPGTADVWLPEVERFFGEVEAELSRFRPDSGLSRLNVAAGQGPQRVSPMLAETLGLALQMRERTGDVFDPTVLPALRAAGYDRSFEHAPGAMDRPATEPVAGRIMAEVELNRAAKTVTLPEGAQIDLGGIAKGWTVDRAAEMLGAWGAALVDAGGDIRASAPPGGQPWPVAVENPFKPDEDLAAAQLTNGAVATSAILRRKWTVGGREMHHLIDPRTGQPAASDLASVTVLAPTTVQAEVTAKVVLILGGEEGRRYLERERLSGLLVDRAGGVETVGEGFTAGGSGYGGS